MPDDRELYFGAADDTATEYRARDSDPTGGGDFVVAERADGTQLLLKWDDTAGEWVSGGPINLDGNDVTNVGALDVEDELSVQTRRVYVQDTEPTNPETGDIWLDNSEAFE